MKLRIPNPHADDIGRGLLVRILRQAGVNVPGPRTSQPSMTDVLNCLVDQLVHLWRAFPAVSGYRSAMPSRCAIKSRTAASRSGVRSRGSLGSSIMAAG